jgi:hypothetical protein
MRSCRQLPPENLCKLCAEANGGCTCYCRDIFVYDPELTDAEIVERLKADYKIGGDSYGLDFGLKLPERIEALLA